MRVRRFVPALLAALAVGAAGVLTPLGPDPAPAQAAGCPATAGKTIRSAPGWGKTVALTIDDTDPKYIDQFLDILQLHRVRATFFNTGLADANMKASVKRAAAHGHLPCRCTRPPSRPCSATWAPGNRSPGLSAHRPAVRAQ